MDEERQVRPGFLPPRAPAGGEPARPHPSVFPPAEVERPAFAVQRRESGPPSPLALSGTVLGSVALLLLLLSVGFGAPVTGVMSLVAVLLGVFALQQISERGVGRAGQARAAIWVGAIGIVLAVVAMIVIEATDFTQAELQRWLEEQIERQRLQRRDDPGA